MSRLSAGSLGNASGNICQTWWTEEGSKLSPQKEPYTGRNDQCNHSSALEVSPAFPVSYDTRIHIQLQSSEQEWQVWGILASAPLLLVVLLVWKLQQVRTGHESPAASVLEGAGSTWSKR